MVNWRQLLRPGGRLVAVDGFWFTEWDDEAVPALFTDHYTAETRSELPLMHLDRPEPILGLLTAAGFVAVSRQSPAPTSASEVACRTSSRPPRPVSDHGPAVESSLWCARLTGVESGNVGVPRVCTEISWHRNVPDRMVNR